MTRTGTATDFRIGRTDQERAGTADRPRRVRSDPPHDRHTARRALHSDADGPDPGDGAESGQSADRRAEASDRRSPAAGRLSAGLAAGRIGARNQGPATVGLPELQLCTRRLRLRLRAAASPDFLHNAATTAAGVIAGEIAFDSISSIFGHRGGIFGGAAADSSAAAAESRPVPRPS